MKRARRAILAVFPDLVSTGTHACIALLVALFATSAHPQAYVAPPRTVEDILAVLDQYKPDPILAAKSRADAARAPPDTQDRAALAEFYLQRSYAARRIGAVTQRIADLRSATEYSSSGSEIENLANAELASAEEAWGSLISALHIRELRAQRIARAYVGFIVSSYSAIARINVRLGDIASARRALAAAEQVYAERWSRNPTSANWYEHQRKMYIEGARATIFAAEGKFAEEERAARAALHAIELDVPINKDRLAGNRFTVSQDTEENYRDHYELRLGVTLLRQGKLSEAETHARNVLTRVLGRVGRYSPLTSGALRILGDVLLEAGRFREAEQIARAAIDIDQKAGVLPESLALIGGRRRLGAALVAQRRWQQALGEFDAIVSSVERDPELARRYAVRDVNLGLALIKTGQADKAVPMLDTLARKMSERLSDAAYETAEAHGFLAMALAASGQRERALVEFRRAMPVLLDNIRDAGGAEEGAVLRAMRLTHILEAYLDFLGDLQAKQAGVSEIDPVAESFRIADAARGSHVQRALSSSAARAAISDPRLADLARQEQDAELRLGVLSHLLSRLLAARPDQQLPKVIADIRTEVERLRNERPNLRREIEKRFPEYANLIDPKPATVEQAQAALGAGEALISIYVAEDKTYVWAIPKQGTPAFGVAPMGEKDIAGIVAQLRRALDVGAVTLAQFPRFDTAAAHRLYRELLQPVESGWKDATSLLIVPHQALGQLPFGVLVTAPANVAEEGEPRFAGYQNVPWLLRKAAITQLPSVNALVTLRSTRAANVTRADFVGFGDPYFSKEQQAQASAQERTQIAAAPSMRLRNLAIERVVVAAEVTQDEYDPSAATRIRATARVANSSTLAQLARLPDTADEIREIAQSLGADMSKDVFLGVQANEKNVKTMNLAERRVIAFATHGLVPGDLNGLEQPALALSAPEVAGIDGDGLLTMEEILALKLNADWVVLSACNTASGEGAGSEAVSGLGRAFFYAGARALLVSNWPVETVSARLLTTDLFKRQVADPGLTRAESLRQTMLGLMDRAVEQGDSGKARFSYAHPMFWAPFSLVGDGGR